MGDFYNKKQMTSKVLNVSVDKAMCAFVYIRGEIHRGSGQFRPKNAKKSPRKKEKKEPLKIAIDCNVKACSMLQI